MIRYSYCTKTFPFREFVEDALNIKYLDKIDLTYAMLFNEHNDQDTYLHKKWYEYIDKNGENFLKLYRHFIAVAVPLKIGCSDFLYQTKPTIRFHLPGNYAVGSWHKDSNFNHDPNEINVFLPITKAFGHNTFWIESKPAKGDYQPVEAQYGDFVTFDGANCTHGNYVNDTGVSRVSFDFRILPKEHYKPENKTSITTGTKFELGGYWSE
jgi:hypothetical protein